MTDFPEQVPVFPLPDHVLLPGFANPYRIFEPRYRALVADLLTVPEERRWLAVPRLADGWADNYYKQPPFNNVAVLSRMLRCNALPNGHFLIVVQGNVRCRLTEIDSQLQYRLATVESMPDVPPSCEPDDLQAILDSLSHSVLTLSTMVGATQEFVALMKERSSSESFVYRIAAAVMQKPDDRQKLLEERCPEARAKVVLAAVAKHIAKASAGNTGQLPS